MINTLIQAQLQRRKQEKKQKSEAVIRKNIQALSERMGALVNCDKYSDVTFNVGPHPGTPIKGHKAILATCSAKFEGNAWVFTLTNASQSSSKY